jgi:hypothetical protein
MVDTTTQKAEQLGHEPSDLHITRTLWVAGGLLTVIAIVLVSVWILLKLSDEPVESFDHSAVSVDQVVSSEPRLQVAPSRELNELLARKRQILHSYGWIDREAEIVHIPIEQAMQLLVKRNHTPSDQNTEAQP